MSLKETLEKFGFQAPELPVVAGEDDLDARLEATEVDLGISNEEATDEDRPTA